MILRGFLIGVHTRFCSSGEGITCNNISPGTFPGEGDNPHHAGRLDQLKADNPSDRLGAADDISSLVGLICSNQGGFIDGQLLQVNVVLSDRFPISRSLPCRQ